MNRFQPNFTEIHIYQCPRRTPENEVGRFQMTILFKFSPGTSPLFLTSFSSLNFPTSPPLQFLFESLVIWCEGTFHKSTNFCCWNFDVTSKVKVTEASKNYQKNLCYRHWTTQLFLQLHEIWA